MGNALQSLFCIAASVLNWVDLLQPERIAISFSVLSDGLHTLIHRHLCPHPWTRQTKLVTDARVTHVAPLDVSPVRQATHSMIIIAIIEVALREHLLDYREAFVDNLLRPSHVQT